ncbi:MULTISPECIES: SH3 domain-containing protein [unclassified Streptomyces]|uniref:SH3 domain-containing protein n=1 Tax=unclassified Streptomyces TaxID=2593676 RepID=UPI00345074BD
MKKYLAGTALAGLALIPLMAATATSAQAAPGPATSPAHASTRLAGSCTVRAEESLNLRQKPTTRSVALGVVPKGATARCYGRIVDGGTYRACSRYSDNYWMPISYKGTYGYVPRTCMDLVS